MGQGAVDQWEIIQSDGVGHSVKPVRPFVREAP